MIVITQPVIIAPWRFTIPATAANLNDPYYQRVEVVRWDDPPPELAPDLLYQAKLEASRRALANAQRLPAMRLEERQYHRPKRRGRSCGSRHRVMLT